MNYFLCAVILIQALVAYLQSRQISKLKVIQKESKLIKRLIYKDYEPLLVGTEVWIIYENRPQKAVISRVYFTDREEILMGKYHGDGLQYNLRLQSWKPGCVGIDTSGYNIALTKEELLSKL